MKQKHGRKNFDFVPSSYLLPAEFPILLQDSVKMSKRIYICKPVSSSQGKGIFLTDDVDEVSFQQSKI